MWSRKVNKSKAQAREGSAVRHDTFATAAARRDMLGSSTQRCLELAQGSRVLLDSHVPSGGTYLRAVPAAARSTAALAAAAAAQPPDELLVTVPFQRGALGFELSADDGITCVAILPSAQNSNLGATAQLCVGWTLVAIAGQKLRWSSPDLVLAQIDLAPRGPVALSWRTNGIEHASINAPVKPTAVERLSLEPLTGLRAARQALAQTLARSPNHHSPSPHDAAAAAAAAAAAPPSPEQFDAAVGQLRQSQGELAVWRTGGVPEQPRSLSAFLPRSPLRRGPEPEPQPT